MIDNLIIEKILLIQNDIFFNILNFFTTIGSNYGIFFIVFIYVLFSKDLNKYIFSHHTLIIILLNNFLKFIFHRDRPSTMLIDAPYYSFPSGHAMISTFVFGYFIYQVRKNLNIKNKKLYLFILYITLFLICFSRIYFMVHYFTDVIVGFLISYLYLKLFISKICE
ncbi:MAG: phosphatase PAP2 family protein [bacterium]